MEDSGEWEWKCGWEVVLSTEYRDMVASFLHCATATGSLANFSIFFLYNLPPSALHHIGVEQLRALCLLCFHFFLKHEYQCSFDSPGEISPMCIIPSPLQHAACQSFVERDCWRCADSQVAFLASLLMTSSTTFSRASVLPAPMTS